MKYFSISFALTFLFILVTVAQQAGKPVYYKNGVVVSAHPEASRVGLEILKKGGNAVDAAVAVQFALAVVFPTAGNIGGGGFLVYRDARGNINSLDYREKAPLTAGRDMYLGADGNVVPGKSLYGHLAPGVPGTVDGMVKVHEKYGKLSWKEVVQPAVELAEKGFHITAKDARSLNSVKQSLIKYNPEGTAFVKEEVWKMGDVLIQKELVETLKRIRDNGRAGFYDGKTADLLVAEMNRGAGLISKKDLADYHSVWRTPVTGMYKGYKVISMPPPSSGGIALMQLLHAVEPYPLSRWGHNQDSTVQLIVEAERRVYADRSEYLGDPDFYKVPQKQLLDTNYIRSRMNNFSWDKATPSSEIKPGKLMGKESEETTHYSIVDKQGNAVSVTTTLNGTYGSRVVVKGAGFLLNNEMDDFSAKPGTPNLFGVTGGAANAIAPGKRMLSSMTPTIIEKDGKLYMVVGTPGGSTIITSVFQTILNVLEFGQDMQQAVSSSRFHHQWLPDEVYIEKGTFNAATEKTLKEKGYKFVERSSIGRVDAILKTAQGYQGGADPRGDDTTAGW
ncbi:gamma-glutamyltransferase [Pedobacter sp. BS3]|uniref:gamma-glutamyltransferase n=1 Tax=Pedobacter sp. BS3 TaxID=2567937 RepID=UPI0011EC5F81|nr:gamma-glutamyltransferase [Pedobacter sp. BS3]TZF84849.1 gamma-glutamyltransferase [Pedobacter sp. BS3]